MPIQMAAAEFVKKRTSRAWSHAQSETENTNGTQEERQEKAARLDSQAI